MTFVTFLTYTLINANSDNPEDRLTPAKVFVSLSLFNVLRFPLIIFPMLITMLIEVRLGHVTPIPRDHVTNRRGHVTNTTGHVTPYWLEVL